MEVGCGSLSKSAHKQVRSSLNRGESAVRTAHADGNRLASGVNTGSETARLVSVTVRSRGNDIEACATISNAADRRVDDGQADSLMGCDDASTENGAPGASVREMTNAVRTVEPVQGPSFLAPTSTNAGPLVQPLHD